MIYTYGGGGHCRLGRTIHVPDLRSRKALQQKCRGLHGECFTAKEKTPHAWKHCFRKFLFDQAHLRKRRRGDPRGGAGICKRAIKHFGICHQVATNTEECPSGCKTAIKIHDRQIE